MFADFKFLTMSLCVMTESYINIFRPKKTGLDRFFAVQSSFLANLYKTTGCGCGLSKSGRKTRLNQTYKHYWMIIKHRLGGAGLSKSNTVLGVMERISRWGVGEMSLSYKWSAIFLILSRVKVSLHVLIKILEGCMLLKVSCCNWGDLLNRSLRSSK